VDNTTIANANANANDGANANANSNAKTNAKPYLLSPTLNLNSKRSPSLLKVGVTVSGCELIRLEGNGIMLSGFNQHTTITGAVHLFSI
jgi:hypothetical protein